ncbi:MAG: NAD(P)-binding domain-containing protein, partial [Desulfofustis sp.]|nr:NAD(P)-binding domain-containing protein [Desulfofustis sp.]
MVNTRETTLGFIGLGVMGKSMASNLMTAGYRIHVFNRTKAKAKELINRGAVWQESHAGIAAAADIIITMIGYPKDVEEVYLGSTGILTNAQGGSVLIDMTTSSPQL